ISWVKLWESVIAAWFIVLLAACLVPWLLYRGTSGEWLAPFQPVIKAMTLVVQPLVFFLQFLESRPTRPDGTPCHEEAPISAENIEALISAGAEEGLIEEDDKKLIQSVVEFGDTTVREVMTPRPNIVAISANASLDELRQLVIHEQYSRIPIYENS